MHNESADPLPHLRIYGVGEYWGADCDERIIEEKEGFSLLLLHNPDGIKLFKGKKIDLILSGHLHNGQINLPYVRNLFLFKEGPYLSGWYDKMYVNKGLAGTLPLRFASIPEISFFELKYG